MGNEPILWLHEIQPQDAPLAGSKAAALGELSRKGILVPDGFCISTLVYRAFFTGNNQLATQLKSELAGIKDTGFESLAAHAAAIRGLILQIELEAGFTAEIDRFYRQLVDRTGSNYVAVRSSSTVEDGQKSSGAGQQDSFLNISGLPEVLDTLKKCWASLWNERAIAYREYYKIPHSGASMAVLVQCMVASEVAGVLFTRHPVTGADQFVINASRGLGEAVVAGKVTPEAYILDRPSLTEISFQPGQPDSPLQASESGPKPSRDSNEDRSYGRCLAPGQAHALAALGQEIETLFGRPQDIEWGLVKDRIYILQSRPITTLPPSPSAAFFTDPTPENNELWTSSFFSERFPRPVSPLGWTLIKDLIVAAAIQEPLRFTGLERFDETRFVRLYQGHPFVKVQAYQMMFKYFPEALMPSDSPTFFPDGNTAMRKDVEFPRFFNFFFSVAKTLLSSVDWTPWNYLIWKRFAKNFSDQVDQIETIIERSPKMTVSTLLEQIERLNLLSGKLLGLHRWSLAYANVLMTLLNRTVRAWTHSKNPDEVSLNLLGGLSNQTTRLDDELWKLGRLAEKLDSAGRSKFALGQDDEIVKLVHDPQFSAGMELRKQFQTFLRDFGHRSASLDIFYPPYQSASAQLLELAGAGGADSERPMAKVKRQRQVRLAETSRLKQALSRTWLDRLFPFRWLYFRTGLTFTQIYMQLRESQRFYWQKGLAVQRKAFLLIASEFASQGIFQSQAEQNDIFYLTLPEIKAIARVQPDLAELRHRISSRKAEFNRLQRFYYPPFLEGNRPLLHRPAHQPGEAGSTLHGIPISPGLAQGRARLITGPEDMDRAFASVNQGDILVTIATDPGWTPLFSRLGGLVMETGGQLSHGAVVAREYGIPAVAGIEGATNLIKDGDLLLVNGSEGSVILQA